MKRRHCSVCGKTGHDRRKHQKPTRRNVDFFTDSNGLKHPIRGSDGYLYLKQESPTNVKVDHGKKEKKRKPRPITVKKTAPGKFKIEDKKSKPITGLEIGRNYYTVFGDSGSGRKLIYNGGHSWTAINGSQSKTADSPATTEKVLAYVGRASYHMGTLGS